MLKNQLRSARKAAGKTQQECADYLGVNYSTYSGYETGKREPDVLKIKKIAAFLGVTGDYLLETGFDGRSAPKNKKDTILCEAPEELHLIQTYRSLNAAGKAAAVSSVDGIASNPGLQEEAAGKTTA